MNQLVKLSAFAVAASLGASALGVQLQQNFDSAPADWIENGSRTAPQNFGFSNTNNAGGSPGEAGGTINRAPLAYYHTDVGVIDPSTTPLTMSGLINLDGNNTNEYLGWHNVGLGAPRGLGGTLLGFRVDEGAIIGFPNTDVTDPRPFPPEFPTSFEVTYDPTGGSGDNVGGASIRFVVNKTGEPSFDQTFQISAAARDALPDLTHFGLVTLGESSGEGMDFYDNLSYTSAIPEPASLGLLGLGSLLAVRRRRI